MVGLSGEERGGAERGQSKPPCEIHDSKFYVAGHGRDKRQRVHPSNTGWLHGVRGKHQAAPDTVNFFYS